MLLVALLTPTMCQLLAEYLDTKLPQPYGCISPFYDGNDTVFLFGCYILNSQILKFSISSQTLQEVGRLRGITLKGTLQSDGIGNIFYLGGGGDSRDVYKFEPETNTIETVARLPVSVQDSVSIKYDDTVLILGGLGQDRELMTFNLDTLNYSMVSNNLTFVVTAGATVRVGNKAFLFDDTESGQNRNALELDLDTYDMTRVGLATLPRFTGYTATVWDDDFAYIVTGSRFDSGNETHGLVQFNPKSYDNGFIPVQNFPVESPNYFWITPGTVFIPGLSRIYGFGGESWNSSANRFVDHDEIFYIDLAPLDPTSPTVTPSSTTEQISSSTLNPDWFTCNNRTNGWSFKKSSMF